MFSLLLGWASCWTNSQYAGDLRHHHSSIYVADEGYEIVRLGPLTPSPGLLPEPTDTDLASGEGTLGMPREHVLTIVSGVLAGLLALTLALAVHMALRWDEDDVTTSDHNPHYWTVAQKTHRWVSSTKGQSTGGCPAQRLSPPVGLQHKGPVHRWVSSTKAQSTGGCPAQRPSPPVGVQHKGPVHRWVSSTKAQSTGGCPAQRASPPVGLQHKRPAMRRFDNCVVVYLNKLLKKYSIYRWRESSRRPRGRCNARTMYPEIILRFIMFFLCSWYRLILPVSFRVLLKNRELWSGHLCRHWWHLGLSLWKQLMPQVTTKLAFWQFYVFSLLHWDCITMPS